jgi:hypothetical protein
MLLMFVEGSAARIPGIGSSWEMVGHAPERYDSAD